jgi:LysM repeat protein
MPEPRTRTLSGAVAAAAIPAVVLSGFGAAAPAAAAEVPAIGTTLSPRLATQANISAAQERIAAHLVASRIPSRVTVAAAPSTVTVKPGDTLSHISIRHDVALSTILKANDLSSRSVIYPGQKLRLKGSAGGSGAPASASSSAGTYTVAAGDTLSGIAQGKGMGLSVLLKANGLTGGSVIYPGQKLTLGGSSAGSSAGATATSAAQTYRVVDGDTLSGIAAKNNMSLSALLSANGITSTSIIRPGQKLEVGGTSTVSATSTSRKQLVPSTFLHYSYPKETVRSANDNKYELLSRNLPGRNEMKQIVSATASKMGVDPSLALAHAYQESGFNMAAVSPANAIGAMQVIPSSGEWASQLVGRELDLLNPYDNATAGVAIIRSLQRTSSTVENGIASYYQGAGSVKRNGMYNDTKRYVKSIQALQQSFG